MDRELSDAEVFGAPSGDASGGTRELSDAEVFGLDDRGQPLQAGREYRGQVPGRTAPYGGTPVYNPALDGSLPNVPRPGYAFRAALAQSLAAIGRPVEKAAEAVTGTVPEPKQPAIVPAGPNPTGGERAAAFAGSLLPYLAAAAATGGAATASGVTSPIATGAAAALPLAAAATVADDEQLAARNASAGERLRLAAVNAIGNELLGIIPGAAGASRAARVATGAAIGAGGNVATARVRNAALDDARADLKGDPLSAENVLGGLVLGGGLQAVVPHPAPPAKAPARGRLFGLPEAEPPPAAPARAPVNEVPLDLGNTAEFFREDAPAPAAAATPREPVPAANGGGSAGDGASVPEPRGPVPAAELPKILKPELLRPQPPRPEKPATPATPAIEPAPAAEPAVARVPETGAVPVPVPDATAPKSAEAAAPAAETLPPRPRPSAPRKARLKPPADSAAGIAEQSRRDLLGMIRELGGINQREMADITGEGRRSQKTGAVHTRAGGQIRRLFTKNGVDLDRLGENMAEQGYFPPSEDGYLTWDHDQIRDIVRAALDGDGHATVPMSRMEHYSELRQRESDDAEAEAAQFEQPEQAHVDLDIAQQAEHYLTDDVREQIALQHGDNDADYFRALQEAVDAQRVRDEDYRSGEAPGGEPARAGSGERGPALGDASTREPDARRTGTEDQPLLSGYDTEDLRAKTAREDAAPAAEQRAQVDREREHFGLTRSEGEVAPPPQQRGLLEPAKAGDLQKPARRADGKPPKGGLFARGDRQTETPEFKRWFGNSKVVDADGKPLRMYHGTSGSDGGEAFRSFDTYASNYGLMGQGGYFTADPEVASSYTKKGRGETPTVYPVHLSIKHPLDMDAKADRAAWEKAFPDSEAFHEGGDSNESWYRAAEESIRDQGVEKWEGAEMMQSGIRSMGNDGITHMGGGRYGAKDGPSHRVYIAFDPEQIKSATGNSGAFSPDDPSILHSKGERAAQGLSVDAARAELQDAAPSLGLKPKLLTNLERQGVLRVVESAAELPDAAGLRPIVGDAETGAIKGYFSPEKGGTIYLVADAIKPGEAGAVLTHELVHAGEPSVVAAIERQLPSAYGSLQQRLDALHAAGDPLVQQAFARAEASGETGSRLRSEQLAYLAQSYLDAGGKVGGPVRAVLDWVKRIAVKLANAHPFVKAQLERYGVAAELSGEDVARMLAREAGAAAQHGKRAGPTGEGLAARGDESEGPVPGKPLTEAEIQAAIEDGNWQDRLVRKAGRVKEASVRLYGAVARPLYYRPVQVIRDIKGSPSARRIADLVMLADDARDRAPSGLPQQQDLIHARYERLGGFLSRLNTVLEPLMVRGQLPEHVNEKLWSLMTTGKGSADAKTAEAAKGLAGIMRDALNYQREAGLSLGEHNNYFPRFYDVDKLLANPGTFKRILLANGVKNADQILKQIVDEGGLYHNVIDQSGRLNGNQFEDDALNPDLGRRVDGIDGYASSSGHQKARPLAHIADSQLQPFLRRDVTGVLGKYLNAATRRAEYARAFGAREETLNGLVRQMVDEMEKNGDGRISRAEALHAVYGLADALQGQYNRIQNATWQRLQRGVLNVGTLMKMSLSALSSVSEFGTPVLTGEASTSSMLKGMVAAAETVGRDTARFTLIKALGRPVVPLSEAREAAERIGALLPVAIQDGIQHEIGTPMNKLTTLFMRATLLEQLTSVQKVMAFRVFRAEAARRAANLATDKPSPVNLRWAADYGLDLAALRAWGGKGEAPASLAVAIDRGSVRFTNRVITTPTEATKPLMMQDPHWALLFQFGSFAKVFGNNLLRRVVMNVKNAAPDAIKGDGEAIATLARPLVGAVLMSAAAYYSQQFRDWLKWGDRAAEFQPDKALGPMTDAVSSADRAGLTTSLGSTLYQAAVPYRTGKPLSGAEQAANLLGPNASTAMRGYDVVRSGNPERQARFITGNTPFLNLLPAEAGREAITQRLAQALE